MSRDSLQFDVLVVGAGPAGLAAACRLAQLNSELKICLIEKAAEIGGHNVSGAILDPKALTELFPNWPQMNAPLTTRVNESLWYFLSSSSAARQLPEFLAPSENRGLYIASISQLCRWLGEQATQLGVEVYPGFCAHELLWLEDGSLGGVITGDMGRAADGSTKPNFTAGIELRAKYTLLCEGARGHLGQQLIRHFQLDRGCDPQHFALGIKEVWQIPASQHRPGQVIHALGWPLTESNSHGGVFLYHWGNNYVSLGLIGHLNYTNPHLNLFKELQRAKHHPLFAPVLRGGERLEYAARAIAKGGPQSQPRMSFPGGLLMGDEVGTLNFTAIKGNHTAMKSGMLGAEVVATALAQGRSNDELREYAAAYRNSWLYRELWQQRNIAPALDRWGYLGGGTYGLVDMICRGKLPWTLRNRKPDHDCLKPAASCKALEYPKPDGKLSFDLPSSVYLSNTFHTENQPCHLQLVDARLPIEHNLPVYDEPAQRYCPAGVYEILDADKGQPRLQINAQNCIHCKTCDIKDPKQNIRWVPPEAGGGPRYSQS